jgi:hypothetical protein
MYVFKFAAFVSVKRSPFEATSTAFLNGPVAARNNFNWYGRFVGIFFFLMLKVVAVFVPYLFKIMFNNNNNIMEIKKNFFFDKEQIHCSARTKRKV